MRRTLIVAPWAMAAVLWSLAVTPAFAATTPLHVATTGVDAGDCAAPSAPCRTITYALTQAVAGDTILVAAGEYVESIRINLRGITIEGAGASATTVIGTPCLENTTFVVPGDDVTLRDLAIGGCSEGVVAGIGHVTVEDDLFLETTGVAVSLAGGSATVLDTVFRSDAGVCDRGPGTAVVLRNTFLTRGYGICANDTDMTAHHNRITNQPDIGVNLTATANADLTDNWWGCNEGPNQPGCATLVPQATVVDGWLRLEPIGAPTMVAPGETVELTFGLVGSKSRDVATDFPAAPVTFSTSSGSVDPDTAVIVDGVATTMFTAPDEAGVYMVAARLDGGTASVAFNAPIAASPPPTVPPTAVTDPPIAPSLQPTAPPTSNPVSSGETDRGETASVTSDPSSAPSLPPTAPPTSNLVSDGRTDGGGFLLLAAIGVLVTSAVLIWRGLLRHRD